MTAKHRTLATPLAWLYACLIVYASLSPFTDWVARLDLPWAGLGHVPWPNNRFTHFDVVSNLVGYAPLGILVFGALIRSKYSLLAASIYTLASGTLLSLLLESLQNYLPARVPSSLDWALNSAGTFLGWLVATLIWRSGFLKHWETVRNHWLMPKSAGGMALLLLWPMGLLFPTPVPLGFGQVFEPLQDFLQFILTDTPWSLGFNEWLNTQEINTTELSYRHEFLIIVLSIWAPCLVAFSVVNKGWRRVCLIGLVVVLGFVVTTLSVTLNFGPDHTLAWLTPPVFPAFMVAVLLALGFAKCSPRSAAVLGVCVLTALIVLIIQAPLDPYYAQSLFGWEQGRFIRFHGLAQWIGWLWPYIALVYFSSRIFEKQEQIHTESPVET
jgi:VanZ family protein